MPRAEQRGRLGRVARGLFADARLTWRAQLRSATLLDQIRDPDQPVPAFTFNPADVSRATDLVRLAELERSGRARRESPGELPVVAQTYADLAARLTPGDPRRIELLALAASTWSLGGYQANASALATDYLAEIDAATGAAPADAEDPTGAAPAAIALLTAAVLRRDVREVARLGGLAGQAMPAIGQRLIAAQVQNRDEQEDKSPDQVDAADWSVLAAYGLAGEGARSVARFWRTGDLAAGQRAVMSFRRGAQLMLDALVVDTWALLDNLAHVVEDSVATSPWRMLRRAPTWNPVWERYLRSLAVSDRPIIQVWPSQRQVLDAGLLSREAPNLTVTMPTSAGKTNIAEWAIVHAMARRSGHDDPPLAVYVVPTRALATEVERHLTRTLSPVGIRVSALFGGSEHVLYEMRVIANTDVLVVTSEKFDLLLRNDPTIGERLVIVVADEGHLLGERDRGLRLEMVLSRVRRHTPGARVLVLSAVLPNGHDIARWIDPTAHGKNLAEVTWTPSTMRVGVFEWQGLARDGQRGVVRYRAADADHAFFLPNILTRRLKRVNYYPGTKTETAAELALHYERLGPVLIAAPTKPTAASAAKKVAAAAAKQGITLGADASTGAVSPLHRQLRENIVSAVTEFAGGDHELVGLARAGIAYHHSNVPDQVRTTVEDAYRAGALRIVCATSTLGQGVNLPAKTIIISGTQLDQDLKLSVRDFWNTAGRAARPFKETEGHVVLVAKDQNEALQLQRNYVENRELEPVISTVARLYARLLRARLGGPLARGTTIPETIDFDDPTGDAIQWAETLDLQLLTVLAEEVIETDDVRVLADAIGDALTGTLGAIQLADHRLPIRPLATFAARRLRAVAEQVPDAAIRSAFVRTGLTLAGCISALRAADDILAAINAEPDLLGDERWSALRRLVLAAAASVTEVAKSADRMRVTVDAVPALAADWIDGATTDDLRQTHGATLGAEDPMKFAKALDQLVVHDLAWAVSSVLLLMEQRQDVVVSDRLAALTAMLKFGVNTETACFAASVGVRHRPDAISLGAMFPTTGGTSFGDFCAWVSTLRADDVTAVVEPETAARFLDRAAGLMAPTAALEMLVTESGSLSSPVRGVRHARSAAVLASVPIGGELGIARDYSNPADINAVRFTVDGNHVGYVAREIARVLGPLLDDEMGPVVTATLTVRPTPDNLAELERVDAVAANIVVTPRTLTK